MTDLLRLEYVPLSQVRRWDRNLFTSAGFVGVVRSAQALQVFEYIKLPLPPRDDVINVQALSKSSYMLGFGHAALDALVPVAFQRQDAQLAPRGQCVKASGVRLAFGQPSHLEAMGLAGAFTRTVLEVVCLEAVRRALDSVAAIVAFCINLVVLLMVVALVPFVPALLRAEALASWAALARLPYSPAVGAFLGRRFSPGIIASLRAKLTACFSAWDNVVHRATVVAGDARMVRWHMPFDIPGFLLALSYLRCWQVFAATASAQGRHKVLSVLNSLYSFGMTSHEGARCTTNGIGRDDLTATTLTGCGASLTVRANTKDASLASGIERTSTGDTVSHMIRLSLIVECMVI